MLDVSKKLSAIGRFGIFSGRVCWRMCTPPIFGSAAISQIWTTSIRCLGPVVAVNFPIGAVIALQGLSIFEMFGAQRLLSSLISVAVLRELAPVLASVLVAAQGGSSCGATGSCSRLA